VKKVIVSLFFFIAHSNASETTPLVPELTHPLTLEQLKTFINNKNQLDLRKLETNVFCTKRCCISNFVILNNKYEGLQLLCTLSSRKKAQKLLQNLNELSTKKFTLYENPID
jgi:hypothetical protein